MKDYREAVTKLRDHARDRYAVGEVTGTDIAQADGYVADAELKVALTEQKMNAAKPASELKNAATSIDLLELVRTNLIRFGGVAVTLFLMSVMVPIYRYNVRLGTYYLGRADALILSRDTHVSNFGALLNLLTPDLAFDAEPKTPVDSVASMVKDAAGLVKRV